MNMHEKKLDMETASKTEIVTKFEQQIAALTRELESAEEKFTIDYEEHGRALHGNLNQANENLAELKAADPKQFGVWNPMIRTLIEKTEQLIDQTASVLAARTPESIGWATGQATQIEHDSEGWVEGMGHQEEDSAGWAEGQGQQSAESKGWVEGVGENR